MAEWTWLSGKNNNSSKVSRNYSVLCARNNNTGYPPCRLNTWFSPTSSFPVRIQENRKNNDEIMEYRRKHYVRWCEMSRFEHSRKLILETAFASPKTSTLSVSSSSFAILFNLAQFYPSLFLCSLLIPFRLLSTLVNLKFKVSFD